MCGQSCVDTLTNPQHCNACNTPCAQGVACSGGVCQISQTGSGGGPASGGASGTGSAPASGGAGAAPASGGGTGDGDGDGPIGGYHVHGDWAGFGFTFAAGAATIMPTSFETMLDKDGPYCVSGTVPATPDAYTSIGAVGFNVSQPKISDAPVNKIASTGDGVYIDITINSGNPGVRVQLEDGTDPEAADAAEHRWCANLTVDPSGKFQDTIPWEAFNTTCWAPADGTPFDNREIAKVILYVPDAGADTTADQTFNFCVNDIGPANVVGRGMGEIIAACPSNGTTWSQSGITDQFLNIESGAYHFQSNLWNLVNGGTSLNLIAGGGYKIASQSCKTTTDAPCSFSSVYIGTSADGKRTSGFTPKQISGITSIPTCLGWSSGGTPASDEYNVSYDVWLNSNSGATEAEKFLMVWFRDPPSFQPGGMFPIQDGVVIGDQTWQVWKGPQHQNRDVISYVAPNARADGKAYSFNLKDFIDDAVERGVLSPNQYLIAVMGGMEVWGGAQGASLTGFTAEVK